MALKYQYRQASAGVNDVQKLLNSQYGVSATWVLETRFQTSVSLQASGKVGLRKASGEAATRGLGVSWY